MCAGVMSRRYASARTLQGGGDGDGGGGDAYDGCRTLRLSHVGELGAGSSMCLPLVP